MPASYEDQRKLVQSLETRVQDFRNWQESAAKQVIRVQKKYNKFNSIACDETASNSERATARVNSFNTNGELQSAQNTRDGYPQCIRAEEARLKKARELFGKMKPPVPKVATVRLGFGFNLSDIGTEANRSQAAGSSSTLRPVQDGTRQDR